MKSTKNCAECGNEFTPRLSTIKVCSPRCAIIFAKKKEARKVKNEYRNNDISDIHKRLQIEVNAIARAIDFGLPCLAKGYFPNQMHGGHIFSRGAFPSMKFNLHNIHRQSAQSNHFQNEDGLLRENLKKEYGIGYYEFLESCKQSNLPKIPAQEWLEILKDSRQILKLVRKAIDEPLSVSERIEIRNIVNTDLAIYSNQFSIYKQ